MHFDIAMEPPSCRKKSSRSSLRLQRNMKERDRRLQMKELLAQLSSTIHPQPLKLSVPELVDEATDYVKKLHERTEKLKQLKAHYHETSEPSSDRQHQRQINIIQGRSKLAMVDIRSRDSDLEVNLMCGSKNKFMSHDVVRVLQDEAAEVTGLTYHNVGDNIVIYTIKAQAVIPRIGVETSRIHQRLKELIY